MARKDDVQRYAARRRGALKAARKTHKVEVIFVTNASDIRYLTGCKEGAQGLLCGPNWCALFTSKMFKTVIPDQAPGTDVRVITGSVGDAIASALREQKHRRALGFQGNDVAWSQHQAITKVLGRRKLVSIGNSVVDYRAVKDEREVALIRKCARIAESAFSDLTARGLRYFVGKTEKDLATELEYLMRQRGADRQGFPDNGIIVASGPNSASCHHLPTTRKIRRDEPLLFDWGAELDGYRSDITRTLFMGSVPGRFEELYELVRRANDVGIKAMRPGVRCNTVAKKAWDVIRDGGYGDTIRHGLGHGLGLDVHEQPRYGDGAPRPGAPNPALKVGMVMTVEPGIYFKGEGGIRIEDDILVTKTGQKRLNHFSRRLEDMVLK